jgi:tetratricopeptide (TPR) repeat protein
MAMRKITLSLLILLFPVLNYAQYDAATLKVLLDTGSEQELVMECSRMLQEGYFYHAGQVTDKLLGLHPESCNYNYRKGYILLGSRSDFTTAIPYLEKAVQDIDKNFDNFSEHEKSAPTDAIFHLATCYHMNEQIDRAVMEYHRFLDVSNPKSPLVRMAKLQLLQCEVAKKNLETPKNVKLINLTAVNTEHPEYSPVISLDGSALYFTSRRAWEDGSSAANLDPRSNMHPEDIYVSYLDFDDSWIAPVRMEFCLTEQNEATMAVSSDERRIYVYQDITGGGDIYYSDFSSNRFNKVKMYEIKDVNTKYWEPHCTVTPDGMNLYFVSDRPGGFGGRDIYRIVKLPDGTWGGPYNLGPTINTEYDEDSPFIAIDNKTLYFSSNGPKSMGGFDVFVSIRNEDNNWSTGINLGYPLNSCGDDLYYTTTVDGLKGYLTSFRKGGQGEKDIYEIENDYLGLKNIAVLKGQIKTVDNAPLPEDIEISVRCTNCGNELERTVMPRLRDGVFYSLLEPCRSYEVVFQYSNGTNEFHRETLETSCENTYEEIYRDVWLDVPNMKIVPKPVPPVVIVDPAPVVEDKPIVVTPIPETVVTEFKNIEFKHMFDYNGNKITTRKGELKSFVKAVEKQLKAGRKHVTINIYSSASQVPTATYETNERLTQLRAENMKYDILTYFQERGDYADRVNVVIVSAIVDGPAYVQDGKEKSKYRPFQFVEIKTE